MSEDTPYIDTPEHRSGYKIKDVIVDGEEWWQGLNQADNAVFLVHKDHIDQFPNFWDDLACELKGGKNCHPHAETRALMQELINHPDIGEATIDGHVEIKNVFTKIQHALSKGADKLDHAEDKALGIDK